MTLDLNPTVGPYASRKPSEKDWVFSESLAKSPRVSWALMLRT